MLSDFIICIQENTNFWEQIIVAIFSTNILISIELMRVITNNSE